MFTIETYADALRFESAEMDRRTDDKISDLEELLKKRQGLKMAAFVPGTNAETPAETVLGIVAERFGEAQARALKKLRAAQGEDASD